MHAACERLFTSPIPPNMARHGMRSLTLWLCALPVVLVGQLPPLCIAAWAFTTSYIYIGIDELGAQERLHNNPLALMHPALPPTPARAVAPRHGHHSTPTPRPRPLRNAQPVPSAPPNHSAIPQESVLGAPDGHSSRAGDALFRSRWGCPAIAHPLSASVPFLGAPHLALWPVQPCSCIPLAGSSRMLPVFGESPPHPPPPTPPPPPLLRALLLRLQVEQPFRTMPLWQLCHLCQLNVEEALCAPEMPLRKLKPSKASAAGGGGQGSGQEVVGWGGRWCGGRVLVSSLAHHPAARHAAPRRRCRTPQRYWIPQGFPLTPSRKTMTSETRARCRRTPARR